MPSFLQTNPARFTHQYPGATQALPDWSRSHIHFSSSANISPFTFASRTSRLFGYCAVGRKLDELSALRAGRNSWWLSDIINAGVRLFSAFSEPAASSVGLSLPSSSSLFVSACSSDSNPRLHQPPLESAPSNQAVWRSRHLTWLDFPEGLV